MLTLRDNPEFRSLGLLTMPSNRWRACHEVFTASSGSGYPRRQASPGTQGKSGPSNRRDSRTPRSMRRRRQVVECRSSAAHLRMGGASRKTVQGRMMVTLSGFEKPAHICCSSTRRLVVGMDGVKPTLRTQDRVQHDLGTRRSLFRGRRK